MATRGASAARAAADSSFERLYRGHRADVFRAALRELGNVHDAEDVTQAAFADAYRAVLRGSRPESPRAWLLAIAANVRKRRYRTAQRRPREEPLEEGSPLGAELPEEHAHALSEALAQLPDEQRRAFVLRELGGLSYDEIADETGSSVGAVQMQLFRARQALRDLLEPPAVTRRRTGLLVPAPGWLTSLFSRAEVVVLTPRAAGALGAAAVAVATSTVAVNDVGADLRRPALERQPASVAAAAPATDSATVPARAGRPNAAPAPRLRASAAAASGQPARPPARVAQTPATSQPAAGESPASAPNAAAPTVSPTLAAATETVEGTVQETVRGTAGETVQETVRATEEAVTGVLGGPRLPDVPVVEEEKLAGAVESAVPPPPSLAPVLDKVLEDAAGAAGVAGDDAPPLPEPPPVGLPPLP